MHTTRLATPPIGWNSFDSFGLYLHEQAATAQLHAFVEKLAPHGYQYFVIDGGWYSEYELVPGTLYPSRTSKFGTKQHLDGQCRYLPSRCYFPNGFKPLIDLAHANGVKFGVHIMRGIPRIAVEENQPITGTPWTARDIALLDSVCPWCPINVGVDMTHPGGQAYYDNWIGLLAEWGVDFIKADDITGHPEEIRAVAAAIQKTGRDIVLSLSPGGDTDPTLMEAYRPADLLRVTKDIWDTPRSIQRTFDAWHFWRHCRDEGVWMDFDMIPFGNLMTMTPPAAGGESPSAELAGEGSARNCRLNPAQKRTFLLQRALSGSPLFVGGELTTLPEEDLGLLTHPEILACNQHARPARPVIRLSDVDIWIAEDSRRPGAGWLGAFNRNPSLQHEYPHLRPRHLGFVDSVKFHDAWSGRPLGVLDENFRLDLAPEDCAFLRYGG